jgi:hypothetical protein
MPQASETNQTKASTSAAEPPIQVGIDPPCNEAGWIIGGDGGTEPPPGAPPERQPG